MLFQVLVIWLCQIVAIHAKFSISNIEKCMQSVPAKPANTQEKRGRQMFLYFGDAGIESMNVLSEYDRKRINMLVKCAVAEDSNLFEDRTGSTTHFHDGGSNVTFLTGIFQTLLPDITHTIKDIAHKAVQHAEWSGDVTHMGIRSVQYLSFYKAGLKAHREETKRKITEKQDQGAFIIFPDQESKERQVKLAQRMTRSKFDPDADEVVSAYLMPVEPPNAVAYTAVLMLSDRAQFTGAEVLITKKKTQRTVFSLHGNTAKDTNTKDSSADMDAYEEDMSYDDEDITDTDTKNTQEKHHHNTDNTHTHEQDVEDGLPSFPQFSAETTSISRYTPEAGSLLLLHGEHQRGLRPVLYGRRNCIVVEFWAYADAPVGVKRPSLAEARPMDSGSKQEL